MTDKKLALGYVRVSGAAQINGSGPDRQKEIITGFAKAAGYQLVPAVSNSGWYEDLAVSGTKALKARDGLTMAVQHCKAEKIGAIIMEKTDRLLRDAQIGLAIAAEIIGDGIELIDAADGSKMVLDNDEPTLKLFTQFKAIIAEWDKNNTVARLKYGRRAKRKKTGRAVEGTCAFGTSKNPNNPALAAKEAAVLAVLNEMQAQRPEKVAAKLAELGLKNRKKLPFTARWVIAARLRLKNN